jgi:hypothetical protein
MNATGHVDELLPGYLAGVLAEDERHAVEEHVAECASCTALLRQLRPAGDALVGSSLDLPVNLDKIFARIDADEAPAATPAPVDMARRRRPHRRAIALVAAAAVALIAFGIGRATAPGTGPQGGAPLADLTALQGERGAGNASLTSERGVRYVRLRLSDLPQISADGFYEAWLGRDDGGMVALGTFRPHADGSADLLLPLPVDADGFDFVDISAEDGDGDPGHSARSVVRGPIRHV